jgi:hypothetical protein
MMPPIGLASAYAKPAIWPSKCYNATSGMAYSNFEGNYDYTLVYSIYANQVPAQQRTRHRDNHPRRCGRASSRKVNSAGSHVKASVWPKPLLFSQLREHLALSF